MNIENSKGENRTQEIIYTFQNRNQNGEYYAQCNAQKPLDKAQNCLQQNYCGDQI